MNDVLKTYEVDGIVLAKQINPFAKEIKEEKKEKKVNLRGKKAEKAQDDSLLNQ